MTDEENLEKAEQKAEFASKSNLKLKLKVVSSVLLILTCITLYFVHQSYPEFKTSSIILISFAMLLICGLFFFLYDLKSIFSRKDDDYDDKKLPKPATLEELREIAKNAFTNKYYANHIKRTINDGYTIAGKSRKQRIYYFAGELLYKEGDMKNGIGWVLINAHYPKDLNTILVDPSPQRLGTCINALATDPEEAPDTKETEIYNPILQTYEKIKETKKQSEEKRDEKPKEELQ